MSEPQSQPERPWYERAANWTGTKMDEVGSVVGDAAGVLDAAGDLGRNVPDVGPLGDIADLVSGVGKVAHWDENGSWDPNHGGWGDIVSGGAGLAEGPLRLAPGVGPAIGGTAQALANGYQAYNKFNEMSAETDPTRRAALEREAWGSTGDATLGALHAGIGSWCPVAELYISGAELALDGLGTAAGWVGGDDAKFGAGDVVGGLLDAVIPEEEDAWSNQAGNWVHDAVGGGTTGMVLGATAAGVTNVAAAPINIADAAAGGIVNTIGNMFDTDPEGADPVREDYWGQFKDWAGDGISSGASAAWDWTTETASNVGGTISETATNAWNGGVDLANRTGTAISNTASDAWDGASNLAGRAWDWTTETASNVGGAISSTASDAWDGTRNLASRAGTAISDTASDAWDGTRNLANRAGTAISNTASDAWDGTRNLASRATNAVTSTTTRAVTGAGNLARRATSAVTSTANRASSAMSSTANRAWNGATNMASRATNAVSSTANRAWNGATNMASRATNAVSSTANRAWNGATSTASRAWNWLTGD